MHNGAATCSCRSFTPNDAVRTALAIRGAPLALRRRMPRAEDYNERHRLYAAGALLFDELASLCAITSDK